MDSNIINNEAAKLAYEIAGYSHKPVEQVLMQAVRELAARVLPNPSEKKPADRLLDGTTNDIMTPVYDWREGDDILYDENGLPKSDKPLSERLKDVQEFYASLPLLDERPAEEILGYDENGLPH